MAPDDCKDFVTSHMVMVDQLKKPNMILASMSWEKTVKNVFIKKKKYMGPGSHLTETLMLNNDSTTNA